MLLNGHQGVSAEMALRLSKALKKMQDIPKQQFQNFLSAIASPIL
jgi:plasmid maintenance system antidote protein VapI